MGFLTGTIDETPDLTREVEIHDGFVVQLAWLSPKQRDEISKRTTHWKKGQPDIDRDKYAREWTKRAVRGWRGLTWPILTEHLKVVIKDSAAASVQKVITENGGTLPYSADDAALIFANALDERFARVLRDRIEEWDEETRLREEREAGKSSGSSPT